MEPDKWALTLRCDDHERLEDRVALIVEYLGNLYEPNQWLISDLDATGKKGGQLTLRLNDEEILWLSNNHLVDILMEEGQIIELDATLVKNDSKLFRILIQDGVSIDILGTGQLLPLSVLGNYGLVDTELFMW